MNIIIMLQNVGVVIRVINEIKRPHSGLTYKT